MEGGEILVFRMKGEALPKDAGFEIRTPRGTFAIRGSSMGVKYFAGGEPVRRMAGNRR
jgi:hypothetical protein